MKQTLLLFLLGFFAFTSQVSAQNKRGADFYKARMCEFEGKEIRIEVRSAQVYEHNHLGVEDPSMTLFWVYTVDGYIYAQVPEEKLRSFERKYANKNGLGSSGFLRGTLRKSKSGTAYIEVEG